MKEKIKKDDVQIELGKLLKLGSDETYIWFCNEYCELIKKLVLRIARDVCLK